MRQRSCRLEFPTKAVADATALQGAFGTIIFMTARNLALIPPSSTDQGGIPRPAPNDSRAMGSGISRARHLCDESLGVSQRFLQTTLFQSPALSKVTPAAPLATEFRERLFENIAHL